MSEKRKRIKEQRTNQDASRNKKKGKARKEGPKSRGKQLNVDT